MQQLAARAIEEGAEGAQPVECKANCAHRRPARMSWTQLPKRVFEIDLEHCPNCGGEMKITAAILDAPVIEKILPHLGLRARAPPRGPTCRKRPDRHQVHRVRPAQRQGPGRSVLIVRVDP